MPDTQIALPKSPATGEIFEITPEKKLIFQDGVWKLFTNNLPISQQVIEPDYPPYLSEAEPSVEIAEAFWLKPSTGAFSCKVLVNGSMQWQKISIPDYPPFVSATEPSTDIVQAFWLDSTTNKLYFKNLFDGVAYWNPIQRGDFAPIVSSDEPSFSTEEAFWYNPSNDRLYFKYMDGDALHWFPIRVPQPDDYAPIVSAFMPAITSPEAWWINPVENKLYYKRTTEGLTDWALFTPTAEVQADHPAVVSETAPTLLGPETFWYVPSTATMHFKKVIGGNATWEVAFTQSAGGSTDLPPITAASAPELTVPESFWFNSTNGELYFKRDTAGTKSWESVTNAVNLLSAISSKFDEKMAALLGVANGLPYLDAGVKIPAAFLPGFVDDVLEFANQSAFPVTGESGKIYIDLSDSSGNGEFRWGGTGYVQLTKSPGSTDAVPEGALNKYFTDARARAAVTSVSGNAGTATKLATGRKIQLAGDATGEATFTGENDVVINVTVSGQAAGAMPYDVMASIFGKPADGEYLLRLPPATRAFTLSGSGSASCGVAATETAVLTVYKNGTAVGVIGFVAGSNVGGFSIATPISVAVGDRFSVRCPTTADATLADIDVIMTAETA